MMCIKFSAYQHAYLQAAKPINQGLRQIFHIINKYYY